MSAAISRVGLVFVIVFVFLFVGSVVCLNNGVSRTPAMGYNTWNAFSCDINEKMLQQVADVMISSGLNSYGYKYLNLDDCWQSSRDAKGVIVADPNDFPSGIPSLSSYAHSKGLLFGLYTDLGYKTCGGRPGTLGYEFIDANTYASWNVDYIKVDNCNTDGSVPEVRYPVMRDALNSTGKPILFSMCEWGVDNPALWAPNVGNSWRATDDIGDNWGSMLYNMDINAELWPYAGPGGFNDPDLLEVGNGGMTTQEYTSHFTLWALMKSPLIISSDIRNMSADTFKILTNSEVIAVNQDALGVQARKVSRTTVNGDTTQLVVQSVYCYSGNYQQFKLDTNTGALVHVQSGQCLTVKDCNTGANAALTIEKCHPGSTDPQYCDQSKNQQWILDINGQVQSLLGTCLDLSDSTYGAPGPVVQSNICNSTFLNQKWVYDRNGFTLRSARNQQCVAAVGPLEVFAGPLADGSLAVALFNRLGSSANITANWSDIGLQPTDRATVRDLWLHQDLGTFQTAFSAIVPSHGIVALKISKSTATAEIL